MGKRGRRQQNGDSGKYYSDSEPDIDDTPKPLWSMMIQDTDNTIMNLNIDYTGIDSRFKWVGLYDVKKFVRQYLFEEKEYKKFVVTSMDIEGVVYNYILNIFDIMDLGRIPIVDNVHSTKNENGEEELVDPDVGVITSVTDKTKFIMFMNKQLLDLFSKYHI
jgi:hypothetical protein